MGQTSSATAKRPPPTTSGNSPQPPLLIPNLPDDIAIQCIARVPRPFHTSLSLVSKSWRRTIRSPRFFATRSLLHSTQHSLYLNIRHNSSFKWFYHPNPYPNPNYKHLLSSIPPFPVLLVGPAYAVLGHKLFVIGGSFRRIPSSSVWILDCRVNKWEYGPQMKVGREFATAATVNGKIYVMSGYSVDDEIQSDNWAEVYDPEVGVWCAVPSCDVETKYKGMHGNAVIDGKIYALSDTGGVVYDVVEMKWGRLPEGLDSGGRGRDGVIGGVYYRYDPYGTVRWYDVERDVWRELRGVENGLPKFLYNGPRMLDLDGRLCVVWDCKRDSAMGKVKDIMCAVINVCKDEDGGLCGSVLWVDAISSVPLGSTIEHCMTVAL